MPNNATVKTKSARKRVYVLAALLCVGIAAFIVGRQIMGVQRQTVTVNGHVYYVKVVKTPREQERGLSGTTSLPAQEGMLFAFKDEASLCFWMKNMLYPIDMIWATSDKKISAIQADVQLDSYPKQYCSPGQYVLELASGEAGKSNIQVGDKLNF